MASLDPNELSNEIIEIPLTHFPCGELESGMYTNGQSQSIIYVSLLLIHY